MTAYTIRRLLLMIPTLFLVTVIVFFSIRLIPGSVVDQMVEGADVSTQLSPEELRAQIEAALGLDKPIHVQYGHWIWNIVSKGDLGNSLWTKIPVAEALLARIPISLELGLMAMFIALMIALPVGVYSAIRQDTVSDYIGRSIAILCIALPSFWLGTMVIIYPAIWWGWSPAIIYIPITEDLIGNLQQFVIPAAILGMIMSGTTMRMTRTMMLEVLRHDYIRTAWAKGLDEKSVVMRHALKNALIPVVTIIGIQLPLLIGGSVILEYIFTLPGLGAYLVQVLNTRDYTVLSGINLFMATLVLVVNLFVDLTYGFLDPRVHYK